MTLTETAALTKKVFIFGVIFFIFILLAWLGFQYYYYKIYLPGRPPKVEIPTVKFGPLPKINLPQDSVSSSNFSYTLDTETGSLPTNLPPLVKVYPITPLSTDLLALDRARSLADKLDFKNGPEMLSSTQYKFIDKNGGEFIITLDTGNFSYKHNESSESANFQINEFPEKNQLVSDFKNFLSLKSLLKEQIQKGKGEAVFDRTRKEDSNLANVSLWQDDIEKIPIITPTFKEGLIKGIVTKSADEIYRYRQLNYTYWPVDYENSSTYPILTPDEAFALLKNGEGSVVIEPPDNKASITKVYLGYFLSEEYEPYLQPVYVFEGNQFVGLVSAIHPDQIAK